eukprot:CAMPEP_0183785104 /NCGR_PEP_ID=MMETSP0739-20130205/66332_1 /TAXON_ID=385413 /ORGANISM="Thalassiosira miniscula, Strain CCMP1093" /LENGTH=488 /DNA_ID=CAMNT_0026029099 /DNA_START=207 /DNA_END=1672 /DNA_ORIENTATION=-
MMHRRSPNQSAPLKRQSNESRRSSTDSQNIRERGNSSGSGFCSISSSFFNASAPDVPLRYVDTHEGNAIGSSSTLGSTTTKRRAPKREELLNNNDKPPLRSSSAPQWTALERAELVDRDYQLRRTLEAEVKKAGVVTAAGYKAVHRQFLYSEAVEREIKRVGERKQTPIRPLLKKNSSRFGGLLSRSVGNISESLRGDVLNTSLSNVYETKKRTSVPPRSSRAYNLTRQRVLDGNITSTDRVERSLSDASPPSRPLLKKQSSRFGGLLSRSVGNSSSQNDSFRGDKFNTSQCNAYYTKNRNIAPVKTSQVCILTQKQREELLDGSGASINSIERVDSDTSLDLQDVFDGTEGSCLLSPPFAPEASPKLKEPHAGSDVLTEACTTLSRLDTLSAGLETLSVGFGEVNFDPDTVTTTGTESVKDFDEVEEPSEQSDTDEFGWLPWPEKSDNDDICSDDGDLLVSFKPMRRGSDSFLPWPDSPRNNRARAA